MDQDDLEDEVFTKTILTHLEYLSRITINLVDWESFLWKREALCGLVVFVFLGIWLVHSSRNSLGFFWSAVPMAGISGLDLCLSDSEEQMDHAAVYALRGRRNTMEDRYAMIKIDDEDGGEEVVLHAVLDGHGGEFAAIYVKTKLLENLEKKIRALKILRSRLSCAEKVEKLETVLKSRLTRPVLESIGMSVSEYEELRPYPNDKAEEPSDSGSKTDTKPLITISSNLVLSCRIKPIEELPTASAQKVEDKEMSLSENMLSPYNNVPNAKTLKQRRNSRSPSSTKESDQPVEKDLPDYLNSKQEIIYADLIKDEVAKIDQSLVKDSKKEGQIGGTCLLLTILDGRTLWVANVGDSRGVLCNARGDAIPLSFDHKPCQLKEKKRIQEAGGYVAMNGVWRVQGVLATSRALGDYPLKEKKVIVSEPDILSFQLSTEPHLRPEFAILASDGLWDVFTNEEAVAFARKHLWHSHLGHHVKHSCCERLSADKCVERLMSGFHKISFGASKSESATAKSLAKEAYSRGSTDNVTVVVINLHKIFADKKKS